jgi:predicted NUDIX family NTP pyrophosphohydrolase
MAKVSAGLLLFRRRGDGVEVLLVHPGGPFWAGKDAGAWSIPKGEVEHGEDPLAAARREFEEETGVRIDDAAVVELSPIRQRGGKVVRAWAIEGDFDPASIRSNTFSMEWPPRSGRRAEFAEVDRAEFFMLSEARKRINPAQVSLIDELEKRAARRGV